VVSPYPRRAHQAPWQHRIARLAVPALLAGLGTTGIVAVATGSTVPPEAAPTPSASVVGPAPSALPTTQALVREQPTSRGAARAGLTDEAKAKAAAKTRAKAKAAAKAKAKARAAAKAKAKAKARAAARAKAAEAAAKRPSLRVVDTLYTRVDLNVRSQNDAGSRLVTVLDSGSKVSVTRTVRGPWRFIAYRGAGGWVKSQYLVQSKPKRKATAASASRGISSGACAAGSAVESGLTPDAVRVHRAICAQFPSVKAYGGVRADSLPEHPSGRALDAMISDNGTGWAIANFVRSNAKRLGVSQVLFDRHIWTVQRGSEGWRSFSDRGSPTANHEDHVHVTVYGSSGG
jgi:hypothetical protein